MTNHDVDQDATDGLSVLLGPRRAEIMRLIWSRGALTVREVHALLEKHGLAYTTVMTTCTRLAEKGLLERRRAESGEMGRHSLAHVYAATISEAEFVRVAVGRHLAPLLADYPALVRAYVNDAQRFPMPDRIAQPCDRAHIERLLAYLAELVDATGQRVADAALNTIMALLDRAEAAARYAATQEAVAQRALACAEAAERRAVDAERRTAAQYPLRAPSGGRSAAPIQDLRDEAGICRVCGCPVPLAPTARTDGLRVCASPECRQEGRRRDNVAKQRRATARRRAQRAQTQVMRS